MLIDGIDVIGIVQHHAQKPAKLGNKRAQYAGAMHLEESFVDIVFPFQNFKERNVRRRRASKMVIYKVEMATQQFPRYVAQTASILLHVVEDLDQVARHFFEDRGVRDRELVVGDPHSLPHSSGKAIFSIPYPAPGFVKSVNDQRRQAVSFGRM